jgi:SAM-dependent methyltransferase
MPFVSALDAGSNEALFQLEQRMAEYYANPQYHAQWIRNANTAWHPNAHGAQLAASARIPDGATLLEVGCGDTGGALQLLEHVPDVRYHGVDISIPADRERSLRVARASGIKLPFAARSFDVVISMFTIEHTIFPHRFLDECWRVLHHGGKLQVIAPDFLNNAMASERIGFGYGTGRDKLMRGRLLDAAMTFYDSRIRLPLARRRRARELEHGGYYFPILTNPRCLSEEGFVTDCDAVYPSCPEEIGNYMRAHHGIDRADLFFRDANTFGIEFVKP